VRQFFLQLESGQSVSIGDVVALDKEESHHLFTVLRGGRQSQIILTDGRGMQYEGQSAGKNGKTALVEIVASDRLEDEVQHPQLCLYCGVVKGKRFEFVLEKAVELGVHRIVPLLTEHGVVDPREKKQDRWHTILKTALKQSLRCTLPQLEMAMPLARALTDVEDIKEPSDLNRYFGAVPGELPDGVLVAPWVEIIAAAGKNQTKRLDFFVGPEGGWSDDERALMLDAACVPVDLGPHVLRTETAALAGLALLQIVRSECGANNE